MDKMSVLMVGTGGYRSIEAFLQAVESVRCGRAEPKSFNGKLVTAHATYQG